MACRATLLATSIIGIRSTQHVASLANNLFPLRIWTIFHAFLHQVADVMALMIHFGIQEIAFYIDAANGFCFTPAEFTKQRFEEFFGAMVIDVFGIYMPKDKV